MTSTALDASETGRAFLQHRMALYGLYGSGIGWFFLAFRLIESLGQEEPLAELTDPSMGYHLLGALSLLSIWFLCRGRKRSVGFIRTAEIVGTFLSCAFYALMVLWIPLLNQPQFIALLALSFAMFARAIYVPSSAKRTMLVTGVCGLPLFPVTYYMYATFDVEPWLSVSPELGTVEQSLIALNVTQWTAAWWVCAVALCSAGSHVIYGLRKQVRDVKQLGQYTLEHKVGEGGMGVVYRARHAMLRRPTAVKLLLTEQTSPAATARFEREVQLTASLTHPNTITVFDYGRTPEGLFYYAMEYLDGANLAEVVEFDGEQPPSRVIAILRQVASALSEAHSVGLIHRDIKPSNIILTRQGGIPDVAKVLDFGLVKDLETDGAQSVSRVDEIRGTPQYLAPESITDPERIDARADLYALAAVGYFLLTGSHVFSGNTLFEICSHHLSTRPVPPSERAQQEIPRELEALLLQCLAKAPDERTRSAVEFAERLSAIDVAPWTSVQAREWWAKFDGHLSDRRESAASGAEETIAIDLEDRMMGY